MLDVLGLVTPDWGPYDNDIWRIADSTVVGVATGVNYVVDYNSGDAVNSAQRDLEVGISSGGPEVEGTFSYHSGNLTFTSHSGGRQEFGLNAGGEGTLNMNEGTLKLNAARFGINGGTGTLNLNAGTLTIERGYGDISLWIGHGGGSTANVNVIGGRMFTRSALKLGDVGGTAPSVFSVEGSVATELGIGSRGSLDGAWYQYPGGVLKARFDAGGVTPSDVGEFDWDADDLESIFSAIESTRVPATKVE